jgi:hypothetical protein
VIPLTGIGSVTLKDFDRGVILSLGAELISFEIDGATRQAYAIDVGGLVTTVPYYAPKVPVFFSTPEDVFQPYKLPCVVIRRNDLTPAYDRAPYYGYQRVPAPDAKLVRLNYGGKIIEGYDKYVTRVLPTPFNISYDVQVYARTQNTGITLLTRILQSCRPPFFSVEVFDSLNERRLYDAGEVAVSSASELADIADRTISWTISFDVRGELDLEAQKTEDSIVTTIPEINVQFANLNLNLNTNLSLKTNLYVRAKVI